MHLRNKQTIHSKKARQNGLKIINCTIDIHFFYAQVSRAIYSPSGN